MRHHTTLEIQQVIVKHFYGALLGKICCILSNFVRIFWLNLLGHAIFLIFGLLLQVQNMVFWRRLSLRFKFLVKCKLALWFSFIRMCLVLLVILKKFIFFV